MQCNFKQDNNMKTLHDFPQADITPYEGCLKERLNECVTYRTMSWGNARVELEKQNSTTSARLALTQKVDHAEFIKLFRESLGTVMKLSKTAREVLWYIINNIPMNRGYVIIDNAAVMDFCNFKTRKSVREAVVELLDKNFLSRSTVPKKYWVNPLVLFNGNRIVYANEYILDEADED